MRTAARRPCKNSNSEDVRQELEWNHLQLLLALRRGGSVAAAARELKIDHSTVSRHLAALEKDVGVQVLVRGGGVFTWTSEGERLLAAAETIQATADAALRSVRRAQAEETGHVVVSVPTGYLPILTQRLLPPLREKHPDLRLELEGSYRQVDLVSGDVHVAIRMARPKGLDLIARRAFAEGWNVYAARSYLNERSGQVTPQELADHDLVLYASSLHHLAPLGWMERYRSETTAVTRVDSIEAAVQIVQGGGGIAVLPAFVASLLPDVQSIFPEPIAVKHGWIAYHESYRHSARIRIVIDHLLGFFAQYRMHFLGDTPSI